MGRTSKDGTTAEGADTVDGKPPGAFGFPGETQVFGPWNLPAPIDAPDGIMRSPFKLGEKYILRANFKLPRIWWPRFDPLQPNAVVEIVAGKRGVVIEIDGDDTPHIWGRNACGLSIDDVRFVDVGNGGLGQSTRMFDMVGPGLKQVFFWIGRSTFIRPGFVGTITDYPATLNDTDIEEPESGISFRVNPGTELSHFMEILRVEQFGGPAMVKPMISFLGNPLTVGCVGSSFRPGVGDDVIMIEETTTGVYDLLANSFKAPAPGTTFLAPTLADTVAGMANVDIAVLSVEDSLIDPGVDSAVVVGAYTGLTVGQVILLDLPAPYDGLKTITRVDPTERKIEFAAVFAGTATGAIKITRFTTNAPVSLMENETVEIASVSYNETQKALAVTATTFDMPIAFVTDDGAGTGTVKRRDHKSVGVQLTKNGDAPDSRQVGGLVVMGNVAITTITGQNVWTTLNLAGLAMPTEDIERWEVSDATTGELRFLDNREFNGSAEANISAVSSGSAQRFQFRIVKNTAPMPDDVLSTDGLTGVTDSLTVEAPAVGAVFDDRFRVEVRNIDGFSNLIVQEIFFTTKTTA